MAQIYCGIGDSWIVEVVRTTFYKHDFQVWVGFRKSTCCNACSSSTTGEDNIDLADGFIIC